MTQIIELQIINNVILIMLKKSLFFAVVLLLLVPSAAFAANPAHRPTIVTLEKDKVVNHDYFAAGEIVEISGTVNGDVYAAGGQVFVDGVVNGDLLVAGGTVHISGTVDQDVRAAGGRITLSGTVGRNASIVGGDLELTPNATVGGNLTVGGGNVLVNGPVAGSVWAGTGNLTLANAVGSDVQAFVGNMRVGSTADIAGSVNYTSDEEASIAADASISGSVSRSPAPAWAKQSKQKELDNFANGFNAFAGITSFLTTLLIGFALLKFLPNYSQRVSEMAARSTLKSAGVGFVALVVIPVLIILLLISIIGIPLALLLLFLFIIYLYISRIHLLSALGQKASELTKMKVSPYVSYTIALVVYYLVSLLPLVGGIFKFVVLITALGAVLMSDKKTISLAKNAKVV